MTRISILETDIMDVIRRRFKPLVKDIEAGWKGKVDTAGNEWTLKSPTIDLVLVFYLDKIAIQSFELSGDSDIYKEIDLETAEITTLPDFYKLNPRFQKEVITISRIISKYVRSKSWRIIKRDFYK